LAQIQTTLQDCGAGAAGSGHQGSHLFRSGDWRGQEAPAGSSVPACFRGFPEWETSL